MELISLYFNLTNEFNQSILQCGPLEQTLRKFVFEFPGKTICY